MGEPLTLQLDAPGPWVLHEVGGCAVYMRASKDSGRVAVRCVQGASLRDLGVACDLAGPEARIVINPCQDDWAKTERAQRELLALAQAVWRRHGTSNPASVKTVQSGAYVYEFWADLAAATVAISRRAMSSDAVAVEEHLGHVDRPGTGAAEVRLRQREALPAKLLVQMRALADETWRTADAARRLEMGTGR